MPRYEFSEGTSNKFWQIDLSGSSFTTTFGKIGTAGQTSTKSFDTDAKALSEYTKLVAEKTKKGYQLVGAPAAPVAGVATPRPGPAPKAAPVAAPKAAPVAAPPAATAAAPAARTAPAGGPSLTMTDAAKREAENELAVLAIKPRTADNPIGEWLVNVHKPFVEISKDIVKNGSIRGNADSQRLAREVLKAYGSLEKMPAKLDVEVAAAMLQLAVLQKGYNATNEAVLTFWAAHSGIGFALEAFAASLEGWTTQSEGTARWLVPAKERSLNEMFKNRADLTLHVHWLGATEDQRTEARAHVEGLRQRGNLLQRSALASCVLDPAWIDADLREHASTGARAMFSPEALLVASVPVEIATYLTRLPDDDQHFYTGSQQYGRTQGNAAVIGYSHVQRFGLAGIDIVCARITRILPLFGGTTYASIGFGTALRGLLEVARLVENYPPVVTAALAVIESAEDRKLPKDEDPRAVAYDCLRSSPTIALPLVQGAGRKGWAKNLLPQLERLAGGGADDVRAEAPEVAVPAALRTDAAKFKAPEFWQPAALPKIVLREGTVLAADHLPRLAAVLKAGDRGVIEELKQMAEPGSLAAFGWDLFQAWLTGGSPSKDKWAFTALGLLGTDETARRITPLIRAWPGESQHARAVLGLDVLGDIGSDVALMMLNGIAQKVKFKGLQERAREKMDEIAAKRGMTAEQLADRLVPDLDLEDDGSKTLDFGPRSFRVGFDEALGPFVVDATGTRLKDLPKPNTKDDPALGAEALETWKAMKKDVRALAGIQILRLELAMGSSRRWSGEEFRNFFVEHPLLTHLVRRLVWGVYAPEPKGALQRTFRVAEDRSYADQSDDACAVQGDAVIGIVHRLHVAEDDAAAWGKLFGDYELAQPFEQLGRATYRLAPHELGGTGLGRFDGRVVETRKLLALLSRGWRKGAAQDAGGIHELYKPINAALLAVLPISTGLNAGGMDYVDANQTLGTIDFSPSEPSWGSRTDAVALSTLDEVVLSETIRDIESLGTGVEA
jgi:predicted DNA-binding WGR domain protein